MGQYVPYRGSPSPDLMAGRLHYMCGRTAELHAALPIYILSGSTARFVRGRNRYLDGAICALSRLAEPRSDGRPARLHVRQDGRATRRSSDLHTERVDGALRTRTESVS